MNQEMLTVEVVSQLLKEVVSPDYVWPEIPTGWQLEFIVYPEGKVDIDFLHLVSCTFWSEDNGFIKTPYTKDKNPITSKLLDKYGIPYMTVFGHATVNDKPKESHLKSV